VTLDAVGKIAHDRLHMPLPTFYRVAYENDRPRQKLDPRRRCPIYRPLTNRGLNDLPLVLETPVTRTQAIFTAKYASEVTLIGPASKCDGRER
jgi:hypothetical protein